MIHFLEQSWIQALGWTLLHATWQACVVAIIWGVAKQFLKNASAHLRYLAAVGALMTLLLSSAISFWKVYPNQVGISSPVLSLESLTPASLDVSGSLESVKIEEVKNIDWKGFLHDMAPWISLLWILGTAIMGLRFAHGVFYLHKLRNQGLQDIESFWQSKSAAIAHKMGLNSPWQIKESSLVSEPLTLGHFKPLILIPMGMLSGLNPDQVEAIIAHEFAHIYRADFLFNLIQSMIEILFFFHPAVWWLSKEIRRERELCCDDLAVATLGDAFTYAEALTRLQAFCHSPKHLLTMQATGNSGSFTTRIHRLFIPHQSSSSVWKSLSAAILLSIGILGSGFYAYTQSIEKADLALNSEETFQVTQNPSDIISFEENYENWNKAKHSDRGTLESNSIKLFPANVKILAGFRLSPKITDEKLKNIQQQLLKFTDKKIGFKRYRNAQRELLEFFYFNHDQGVFYKSGLRDFEELGLFVVEKENGEISLGFNSETGATLLFGNELKVESFYVQSSDSEKKLQNWIADQNKRGAGIELTSLQHNLKTKALESFSLKQTSKIRLRHEGVTLLSCNLPCTLTAIYDERGEVTLTSFSAKTSNRAESRFPTYLNNKFLGYFNGQVPEIFDQLIEKGIIEAAEDLGNANLVSLRKSNFHSFFEREGLTVQTSMDIDLIDFNKFMVLILNTWEDLAEKYSTEGDEKHRFYGLNGKWVGIRVGTVEEQVKQICAEKGIEPDQIEVKRLSPEQAQNIYHVRAVEAIDIQGIKKKEPISFIYLDEKPLGYFEGGTTMSNLIKMGVISSFEDIVPYGTSSTFIIEKGNFTDFISAKNGTFPESKFLKNVQIPESPSKTSEYPETFALQVVQTWKGLAETFEQEGENKHRMYFLNGQSMGFRSGNLRETLNNICKEKGIDPKEVSVKRLSNEEAQNKYAVRAVEVFDIGPKPLGRIETKEGDIIRSGAITFITDREIQKALTNNYYFFDGKPIGYRDGNIYEVIAKELKARNIAIIGGFVISDADESNPNAGKVINILSEEYEAVYNNRIEEDTYKLGKLERSNPDAEVWLDGVKISHQVLQQINPALIATIDILEGEAIRKAFGHANSNRLINIKTQPGKQSSLIAMNYIKDNEPEIALNLQVSPNPSPGIFKIKFDLDQKREIKFSIKDLWGKEIYTLKPVTLGIGPQEIIWQAEKQVNGIYLVHIEMDNGVKATKRILLER